MKRVTQKDRTSCGLACVAMLAGVSYEDVKKTFIKKDLYRSRPTAVRELGYEDQFFTATLALKELASEYGINIDCERRRKFKSWKDLPDTCILAVHYRKHNDTWHWVVFKRLKNGKQYIADPKPGTPARCTKLSSYKPVTGYLPIEDPN